MVNPLVERATSTMLVGPDWAKNAEICDILNHDIGQAKEVVKGIRKRLRRKNPKVQILTLTLLETLMMNCGDIIHMHVAHKDIPHKMVKIVKKKPDFRVKEKILMLIDAWQDGFGGPRGRYPQYYDAYQDLLHAGAIFPPRSESSAPLFTPPQTHPLALYPQDPHDPNGRQDIIESNEDSEFPTLSLTEIDNARGIMDVLSEMLNAVEPGKKESIKQGVIIDLVQQCRTYKQRVVHLINSTAEESLLGQGLALNDDLQRLLAKHEAIASETSDSLEKPKSSQALIDVDDPEVKEDRSNQTDVRSGNGTNAVSNSPVDLLLPVDSKLDLLSSEEIVSSEAQQSLAIVPVGEPQTTMPASQQDFMDMFGNISPGAAAENSINSQEAHAVGDEYPYDQQSVTYSDGAVTTMGLPQQQDQQLPTYGIQENGDALPPPPWEAQPAADSYPETFHNPQLLARDGALPQPMGSTQVADMYVQNNNHLVSSGIHPMHGNQMMMNMVSYPVRGVGMHPLGMQGSQFSGYDPQTRFLDQRTQGLSSRDGGVRSSYDPSGSPYRPPIGRPLRPEDRLFGDLVSLARPKPNKSDSGTGGM